MVKTQPGKMFIILNLLDFKATVINKLRTLQLYSKEQMYNKPNDNSYMKRSIL